ncbi:MAG: SDR family NAD(P)-dependent oxidoreductase [Geminicoccaceae bacterium]
MTDGLDGRVVLVTGAAGALGRAVATALRQGGARTVLVDRATDRLAAEFPELGGSPEHILCGGIDLAADGAMAGVAATALGRFGRIDGLANVAGGFAMGGAGAEDELAVWDRMMAINLRTTLLACRAVLPAMLRQGDGAIVNVGAGAALKAPGGLAAYSASKAAVLRLTESLAAETKAQGLRVNAVLPGTIDTPANRAAMPDADRSGWVDPADIAAVIAFLLSPAARAVNGAAVPVTGRG